MCLPISVQDNNKKTDKKATINVSSHFRPSCVPWFILVPLSRILNFGQNEHKGRRQVLCRRKVYCPNGYNHILDSLIKNKIIIIFFANGSKMTAYYGSCRKRHLYKTINTSLSAKIPWIYLLISYKSCIFAAKLRHEVVQIIVLWN